MKSFIATIATAFILINSSAFAATEGKNTRSTVAAINSALDQYTVAVSKGQVNGLDQLFSEQFHQRYSNGQKAYTFDKQQIIGFLKANKNIEQQCETNYSVVDESNGAAIAKVEMKYANMTRVDYVTIAQNGKGYQISQVVTTYE